MAYLGNQPVVGDSTNTFKLLDDIASFTLTFDGSSASVVSVANDTLTFADHRFITGQRVTYGKGGGTVITGLTDATAYFIIKVDQNTIKLATNASNAASSTAIDLTGLGAGTSHTLKVAFDGVNTKFKATHSNGTKSKVSRAAQISLSINGVIQQPTEAKPPTVGYGIEPDSTIVFSSAPQAGDNVFGSFIGEAAPSFDITDNTVDNFTGDGSTTSFTLSKEIASSQDVLVTLDGVTQYPSDTSTTRSYSVVGQTLLFVSAPDDGVAIQARLIGFAGATSSEVTGFYGRTGNVALKSTDDIAFQNASAGIITASKFVGELVGVVTATDVFVSGIATFSGDVGIAGTLTYEDVTNIDSVGIITARSNILVGSGITLSPDGDVFVTGISTFSEGIAGDLLIDDKIVHRGDTNTSIRFPEADTVTVETGGSEGIRIDSGGRLLVGTTAARTFGGSVYAHLQLEGTTQQGSQLTITRNSNDTYSPNITLCKTRGTSDGAVTTVQDNDSLGTIQFRGADGSDVFAVAASITGEVDGSPSDGTDMPGALVFGTTADGAASPTERLRITSSGQVFIGDGVTSSYDFVIHRNTNGNVVSHIVNTNTGSSTQSILQLQVGSKYVNFTTNHAAEYLQLNGSSISTVYYDFNDHKFRNSAGAESLVIDSAGNATLKGGVFSLAKAGAENKIEVGAGQNANHYAYIDFIGDTTYSDHGLRLIRGNGGANAVSQLIQRGTGTLSIVTQEAANLAFFTNNTTRMMIHSGGTVNIPGGVDGGGLLHIGQNTSSYVRVEDLALETYGIVIRKAVSSTYAALRLVNTNGHKGNLNVTNSGVALANASDYRLKENETTISDGITRVKQLIPRRFNFKTDSTTVDGFFAHEVSPVVPESVFGEKDAIIDEEGDGYQMLDQSKLIPVLTASIKELIAKVENLEAEVAALKG